MVIDEKQETIKAIIETYKKTGIVPKDTPEDLKKEINEKIK